MTGQGQLVAEDRVVTAGKPAKIGLHAEKTNWSQMGKTSSISILMYWTRGESWVPTASNQLHFEIEGPA